MYLCAGYYARNLRVVYPGHERQFLGLLSGIVARGKYLARGGAQFVGCPKFAPCPLIVEGIGRENSTGPVTHSFEDWAGICQPRQIVDLILASGHLS